MFMFHMGKRLKFTVVHSIVYFDDQQPPLPASYCGIMWSESLEMLLVRTLSDIPRRKPHLEWKSGSSDLLLSTLPRPYKGSELSAWRSPGELCQQSWWLRAGDCRQTRVMSPLPASGSLLEGEERPVAGRQDQRPGNIPTFLSSCLPFRYNLKECTCPSVSTVACVLWLG